MKFSKLCFENLGTFADAKVQVKYFFNAKQVLLNHCFV